MSKVNAKDEFLKTTSNCVVIAANIEFGYSYDTEGNPDSIKLKPLYTSDEYDNFLKFLDRVYDSGYGGQELYGIIYCEDGIWMDRGEYDGSEWWNFNKFPDMREDFDEVDVLRYERNKKLKNIKNLL